MKEVVQVGAASLLLASFAGCVAVKVPQPADAEMRQVSETKSFGRSEVSGVEPSIVRTDDAVCINVNLLGKFDIETQTVYAGSSDEDDFVAVGLFPGVMSCRGEYGECLQNASGACLYNLVFVGFPTVYGLLVEPFVPHYPQQTDSIFGKTAFRQSALMGFSRYSKPATVREKRKVAHSEIGKVCLEDAVISAPGLGLESDRGRSLQIPVGKLPEDGEVKVKLNLPPEHPLKTVMSDYEDAEITVQCVNK